MTTASLVVKGPSKIHGIGLFTRMDIAEGTFIGTYLGPSAKRPGMYVLWVTDEDGTVTARSGRNVLRYLNHSSSPNAWFDAYELYAERPIKRGRIGRIKALFRKSTKYSQVIKQPSTCASTRSWPKSRPTRPKTSSSRCQVRPERAEILRSSVHLPAGSTPETTATLPPLTCRSCWPYVSGRQTT
jgi:hypothetical protein